MTDTLVRMTTTGLLIHVQADGYQLTSGPTFDDWRGDWWLAEELLVSAVGTSLLSAFRELAIDARLALGALRCTGEAVFDHGLKRLVLRVELEAASDDLTRAAEVLHEAKESCALANALRVPIDLQITPLPSSVAVAMIEPG